MSIEIVMRDVLAYLLPSIYLYILGTYILVRSFSLKTARLLSTAIFLSAIGFSFAYVRELVVSDRGHLFVLVIFTLSLAFLIYVVYDIVKSMKPLKIPRLPQTLYGFFVLLLFVNLFMQALSIEDESINAIPSSIVSFGLGFAILSLLVLGYKYAVNQAYLTFFKVCIVFTFINFAGIVLQQLKVINVPEIFAIVMAFACMVIVYLLIRLKILPSTVKRYSAMIETSGTAMVTLDRNKRVLEVNEVGKQDFGICMKNDFRHFFGYENEPALLDQLFTNLDEHSYWKGYRVDYLNNKGEERIVLMDASKLELPNETYYYIMVHEVTVEFQRRHLNEQLAYQDVLTGIYNRTYFEKEVKAKLAKSKAKAGALMICDLNFFKQINDTYGHQTGDNVLVFTANCWMQYLPRPNILARLGGDEFVMYFDQFESKQTLLKQIHEARDQFKVHPYKQDDIEIEVVPSIGIAFVGEDGVNYEHLYQTCDVRMYADKRVVKEQFWMKQG